VDKLRKNFREAALSCGLHGGIRSAMARLKTAVENASKMAARLAGLTQEVRY
jgi:hypothetical protein